MSDFSTTIVPVISDYPNRKAKAKEIIEWLISIKAIKPELSDCTLSPEKGYPINDGAKFLVNESGYLPFDMRTNGLAVVTQRTIFNAMENGLDHFVCINCGQDVLTEACEFFNVYYETGNSNFECPACSIKNELNHYDSKPAWAFSNLGFEFYNWVSLTDNFIKDFEKHLSCKVKIVEAHI
jgi:hypothetical protein